MGFHRQRLDLLPVGGCHARAEFDIFFSCFSPIVAKSGSGLPPGIWVRGHAPPRAFGRAAASPQTRQMRCWPSSERTTNPSSRRKRQDSLSLSLVLFPPKPLRWVSAGALLGEVIKTPVLHFFGASMWGGWYHYPRRALHAVETLDARGSRWLICRFYAAPEFAMCGLNLPSSGTHATPAPNRAHSGSHAETRRVLRVDGDDVLGSGIIDTIDPFQADQTVAVALAEGHRNAVSP